MLKQIVSGGQTGADRAGLDFALAHGIPHAGFCPRGRKAEDGPIPAVYKLVETDHSDYRTRTELNVLAAEGTVIFCRMPLSGGSHLTYRVCQRHGRPVLLVPCPGVVPKAGEVVQHWIEEHQIRTLNVAGSRLSGCPKIYQFTLDVLNAAFPSDANTRGP